MFKKLDAYIDKWFSENKFTPLNILFLAGLLLLAVVVLAFIVFLVDELLIAMIELWIVVAAVLGGYVLYRLAIELIKFINFKRKD